LNTTADLLKIGVKAQVIQVNIDLVPLKLLEMGCLPGNEIELIQIAPFGDPMYYNINNGSYLAIRKETAQNIEVAI
jgi:ferrous iron transport protein A